MAGSGIHLANSASQPVGRKSSGSRRAAYESCAVSKRGWKAALSSVRLACQLSSQFGSTAGSTAGRAAAQLRVCSHQDLEMTKSERQFILPDRHEHTHRGVEERKALHPEPGERG